MGLLLLHQFTPGSIAVGSALAHVVAQVRTVSDFPLGETLAQVYYALFPVTPSLTILGFDFLTVPAATAVVAAFSGVIHDPLQAATGIHRRRLNKILDAIENSARESTARTCRPKDTCSGRLYDVIEWTKGLLSFR